MQRLLAALFAVILLVALSAQAGTMLILSTPDPSISSISIAAGNFSDLVKKMTKGEVTIEVHPNGSLFAGDPGRAIKMVESGAMDMLLLSSSLYAHQKPRFSAVSIPYLFKDAEQVQTYFASEVADALKQDLASLDIHPLGFWPRSFRILTNSKREVRSIADLKGLKLRVPNNPLWIEFFRSLGAAPTPIAFNEVYGALESGVVDGQENPINIIMDAKLYEVQKYLTCTEHIADTWVLSINQEKWNTLPDSVKKALQDASIQAQSDKARYDAEGMERTKAFLKTKGMEVIQLAPEEKAKFVEAARKLYPRFGELVKDPEFFRKTLEFVGEK